MRGVFAAAAVLVGSFCWADPAGDAIVDVHTTDDAQCEGWLTIDFTAFDREVSQLLRRGTDAREVKATAVSVKTPADLSTLQRFKYTLSVRKHLREKGWTKALVLVDGEPVFARDEGRLANVAVECDGVMQCRGSELQQPLVSVTRDQKASRATP